MPEKPIDKLKKKYNNYFYAFFVFGQSCNCPRPIGKMIPEE